ncbi:VOC family protein [Fretibacter rubidus]|uniref:VOC family protein n=1 Tax=Fretibacter rubidus TaxID=570162 RepID=UPI00352AD163
MSKPAIRFQRSNFVVANIERALTFYRDVLGFDVVFIKDSAKDSYSYDVFEIERHNKMRFAVLGTTEQANVMALTEVPDAKPIIDTPRRSAIILEIRDIDRVLEQSRALGLKVYPEDKLITKDGREGREIGIVDFDGNLVVIYLITKAAA